jgi:DNA (cytosine-5)-methyltransferase 1
MPLCPVCTHPQRQAIDAALGKSLTRDTLTTGGTNMLDMLREMRVAEYFAGMGLMRLGLEAEGWQVVWANDTSESKQRLYTGHFGAAHFVLGDVHFLDSTTVPMADLATASFPCIDLSLAGDRKGLAGPHSSAIWGFLRVLKAQGDSRPSIVLLENVTGFLSSHGGCDFALVAQDLADLGYTLDALILDAAHFAPLSRRRLFLIGVRSCDRGASPDQVTASEIRPQKLLDAMSAAPAVTWRLRPLPAPPACATRLDDVVDAAPDPLTPWWPDHEVAKLIGQMAPTHRATVDHLIAGEIPRYASVARRTRDHTSHAEVMVGAMTCLRTLGGGSSNPFILRAGRGRVDVRRISPREAARLMGAPDYRLSGAYTTIVGALGDAVNVDVVRWIAGTYLNPLIAELRGAAGE